MTENVAPGSVIASGPFGITFPPGRSAVFIPFAATGSEATAPFYDARWYEDFDLLIASDYDYGRYAREPGRFEAHLQFYDTLRTSWRLLAEFSPDSLRRGPTLWCFAPDPSRRAARFDAQALRRLGSVDDPELVGRFVRNLSGALFTRGKREKCAQLLEFGIGHNPGDATLLQTMAFLLFREGRFGEAMEYVKRSAAAGGESFEMLTLEASMLIDTGEPDRAADLLRRATELRPESTLPLQLLIRIESARGNRRGLIAILERYSALIPQGGDEAAQVSRWLDSLKTGR